MAWRVHYPRPALQIKSLQKLGSPQKVKPIAMPVKQWAAAAVLLLALNIGSVLYFTSYRTNAAPGMGNPLMAEMPSVSTYNY